MTSASNPPTDDAAQDVAQVVARTLAEDVDARGDVTTRATVDPYAQGGAWIVARAEGVLAGTAAATEVFRQVDPDVRIDWVCHDGDRVAIGTRVARIEGRRASMLTGERSALNLLCHCSGIATATRRYVDLAEGRTRIRDTRKTTPGLRALEKAAVRAGGGVNHRMGLSDGVLIKDNHLTAISIAEAVARCRTENPALVVEVECDTLDQVAEALAADVDLVLLDNMSPERVAQAIEMLGADIPVEVSGGITLATLDAYAAVRPTYISVGAITHSAPILDLALDFDPSS